MALWRRFILLLSIVAWAWPALAMAQSGSAIPGPRVVLQSRPSAIDVAIWTPDGRYLIAASSLDREIVIIEVAMLQVLDRRFIPVTIHPDGLAYLRFESMVMSPDGRSVLIHGICGRGQFDPTGQTRDFDFNLASRRIVLKSAGELPSEPNVLAAYQQRIGDLQAIYEPDPSSSTGAAEATRRLPALPGSPDSRYKLERISDGLLFRATDSQNGFNREIALFKLSNFNDAALAEDGRRLVLLDYSSGDRETETTSIRRMDVATGRFEPAIKVASDYGFVRWINDDKVLVVSSSDENDRTVDAGDGDPTPPQALVMSWSTGQIVQHLDGFCFVKPAGNGDFLAAGAGNCSPDRKLDRGVFRFDHGSGRWSRLPIADLGGKFINALSVSPDGRLLSLVTEDAKTNNVVFVNDAVTGKEVDQLSYPKGDGAMTGEPRFDPDGKRLYVPTNSVVAEWQFGTAAEIRQINTHTFVPQFIEVGRGEVLASGLLDSSIAHAAIKDGAALPDIELDRAIAGGFIKGRDLFWAVSQSQGFRLWDSRTWRLQLSTYVFPGIVSDNAFLTVTPEGRYDTNLGPDKAPFRWIVDDAPFQSLAPQTFMRDYFTPRLGQKLFDCLAANDCPQVLPDLPPVTSLNRLLPKVKIVGYVDGPTPGTATVSVKVTETVDPGARGRPTHSGVYDVRLFIGGRMVAHGPDPMSRASDLNLGIPLDKIAERMVESREDWRKLTKVELGPDGSATLDFDIDVPTQPTNPGSWALGLSAYAFNSDRVNGEPTLRQIPRGPQPARSRRAYVVSIGVSAYDEPRLSLNFAAKDAHLMASKLGGIAGYEMRQITLAGEKLTNGKVRRVDMLDIVSLVGMLAVGKGPDDDARLRELGVDPRLVDKVTPDDAVIFSFSGHGWADPAGRFYLLGTDASWPDGAEAPEEASVVSIMTLVPLIDMINAGEMAMVIDACHSAASVDTSDFKPGPMGDASLGQLAYDKKIRILAATRSDDLAFETSQFGHGLLTWALAGEGLSPGSPAADVKNGGRVTIDQWLRYASERLPELSREVLSASAASTASDDDGLVFVNRVKPKPKVQEPALFDFNNGSSDLVLNGVAP